MAHKKYDKVTGKFLICFSIDGKRKRFRTGLTNAKLVDKWVDVVETVLECQKSGQVLPSSTLAFLEEAPTLKEKLRQQNLVKSVGKATVQDFFADFIRDLNCGETRKTRLRLTARRLAEDYDCRKYLDDVTKGDMTRVLKKWRDNLAVTTADKEMKNVRQMLEEACNLGLCPTNPAKHLKLGAQKSKARNEYISEKDADTFLASRAPLDVKVIFALARYGGCRITSEVHRKALLWSHVDFKKKRLHLTASKKKGEARVIPLFPKLEKVLAEWREVTKSGPVLPEVYKGKNVGKRVGDWWERVGLKPYKKTFQNLRRSFQTDLARRFPIHVATEWAGNSEKIAMQHYLQATEEDFKKALE